MEPASRTASLQRAQYTPNQSYLLIPVFDSNWSFLSGVPPLAFVVRVISWRMYSLVTDILSKVIERSLAGGNEWYSFCRRSTRICFR